MSFEFAPKGRVEIPELEFTPQIHLAAEESALLIVDMQNDFVKEGGRLVVPAAAETLPRIQDLLRRARAAGVPVAFTQDTHLEGDPEWEIWGRHCQQGSWGWEIVEELAPEPRELVCPKNRYDGFYGTWLEHFLGRLWQVRNLVVVGTVSNICVLHTAGSAGLRWFQLVVPADGISALTPFDQAAALRQISWLYRGKVTRSTEDIHFQSS